MGLRDSLSQGGCDTAELHLQAYFLPMPIPGKSCYIGTGQIYVTCYAEQCQTAFHERS